MDQCDPGGGVDTRDVLQIDSGLAEIAKRGRGEGIVADSSDQRDIGTCVARRERLICALAAGVRGESFPGDRFTRLGKTRDKLCKLWAPSLRCC